MSEIKYLNVLKNAPDVLCCGFISVYKEAFGGAPYYETYTDDQVLNDVWKPHVDTGIVVLAMADNKVVGLGCAQPFSVAPHEDRTFLQRCQMEGTFSGDTDGLWYMSEMAVLANYRHHGIGHQLILRRLEEIQKRGGSRYSFRTASSGSNSARLYVRIGAVQLPGTIDMSGTAQVQVNDSQSDKRIFFVGEVT